MYGLINLPGSNSFRYHGPTSAQECWEWLEKEKEEYKEIYQGLFANAYYPARVVSNKSARKIRFRDGSRVCRTQGE